MNKPYARLGEVTFGTVLVADGGFTCMNEGDVKVVKGAKDGLYVECSEGRHYIDGQLEAGKEYIGLYRKD